MTLIFSKGNFDKTWQQNVCEKVMALCLHSQLSELRMEGRTFGGKCQGHEEPQEQRLRERFKFNFQNKEQNKIL
jgi:hypothetical protein